MKAFSAMQILCIFPCVAGLMIGCASDIPVAAGAGSESVNGYVYDTDKSPAPGIVVMAYKERPAPFDSVNVPDMVDTTDAQGRYEFRGLKPGEAIDIVGRKGNSGKRFLAEGITPSETFRADTLFIPDSIAFQYWLDVNAESECFTVDSARFRVNDDAWQPLDAALYEVIEGFADRPYLVFFEMTYPDGTCRWENMVNRRYIMDIVTMALPPDHHIDTVYEYYSWNPLPEIPSDPSAVWTRSVAVSGDHIILSQADVQSASKAFVWKFTLDGKPISSPNDQFPVGSLVFSNDTVFALDSLCNLVYCSLEEGTLLGRIEYSTLTRGAIGMEIPYRVAIGANGELFVSLWKKSDPSVEVCDITFTRRFTRAGEFLNDHPSYYAGPGAGFPVSAVDTENNRFYNTIPENGRIEVTTLAGTVLDTLASSRGTNVLAVGPEGKLYAASSARVSIYTKTGEIAEVAAVSTSCSAMAVGRTGIIYLFDGQNVLVLRKQGDSSPVPGTPLQITRHS